ncbi:reverse transcriptase (RNA-dependent DNA polymerase) domain-containing protein [Phthorimaea operculella]|nr:reverse transcriptase (RNA-dependent DNA polymerase) domain-containing protein [Phthorimaea operculella]
MHIAFFKLTVAPKATEALKPLVTIPKLRSLERILVQSSSATVTQLKRCPWNDAFLEAITSSPNISDAASLFVSSINNIIVKNTKEVKINRRFNNIKEWVTPGLIRCMINKDRLHLEARKDPENELKNLIFKRYRNFYNELRKKLKSDHDSSQIRDNRKHPKKLWTAINDICSLNTKNNKSTSLLKIKLNPTESLNECNSFFANVEEKLANEIQSKINCTEDELLKCVPVRNDLPHSFYMAPTDTEEIESIIHSLNKTSAPGLDGINSSFLKTIFPLIAEPFTFILNASLSSGIFPEIWKQAVIVPIHKAGPKDNPSNYRPISLLSLFSKVLEKLVNRRLVKYLNKHNIISTSQFGFQSGKSTEDAVGLLLDTVSGALDKGPTLFIIYINNISNLFNDDTHSKVICYADDTAITFTGDSWAEVFNRAERGMALVSDWLSKNLLTLNTNKTKFMCFYKTILTAPQIDLNSIKVHNCLPELTPHMCDCNSIDRSKQLKYLGIVLDEQLSFKQHIRALSGRVRKLISIMKLLRDCADKSVLRMVYTALCQSVITYCLGLWGNSCKSSMIILERAQRSVLKVLYKKPFRYPTYTLYQDAQVLTVRQLFILKASLDQHKAVLNFISSEQLTLSQKRVYYIKPPKVNTSFAQRFRTFSFPYIYSIVNKHCNIKDCKLTEAKLWLGHCKAEPPECLKINMVPCFAGYVKPSVPVAVYDQTAVVTQPCHRLNRPRASQTHLQLGFCSQRFDIHNKVNYAVGLLAVVWLPTANRKTFVFLKTYVVQHPL